MKHELSIRDLLGTHLADGAVGVEFRTRHIEPYLALCREIVLDFTGVRAANSSFMNALIAGLVERHGLDVLDVLVFKGCSPALRVLAEAAVQLGAHKVSGKVPA